MSRPDRLPSGSAQRLVLLWLADRSTHTGGDVSASFADIAAGAGVSRRSVLRAVGELSTGPNAWIEKASCGVPSGSPRPSNIYRVNFERVGVRSSPFSFAGPFPSALRAKLPSSAALARFSLCEDCGQRHWLQDAPAARGRVAGGVFCPLCVGDGFKRYCLSVAL